MYRSLYSSQLYFLDLKKVVERKYSEKQPFLILAEARPSEACVTWHGTSGEPEPSSPLTPPSLPLLPLSFITPLPTHFIHNSALSTPLYSGVITVSRKAATVLDIWVSQHTATKVSHG